MRTLLGTFVFGVCIVASPALAQQHPWVPSGLSADSLSTGPARAQGYSRIRKGDVIGSSDWRTGKPASDELYDSCHSSHPVFACPGSP